MRHIRLLHPVRRLHQRAFAMFMGMKVSTSEDGPFASNMSSIRDHQVRDAIEGKTWGEFHYTLMNYNHRLALATLREAAQGMNDSAPAKDVIYAGTAEISRPFWTLNTIPWVANRGLILPKLSSALDELQHTAAFREEEWERLQRASNWSTKVASVRRGGRDQLTYSVVYPFLGYQRDTVLRSVLNEMEVYPASS